MRMLLNCFSSRKAKKSEGRSDLVVPCESNKNGKTLHIKVENVGECPELKTSFNVPVPFPLRGRPACNVKVISHDAEGGNEVVTMGRDHSYLNHQGWCGQDEFDHGNVNEDDGHASDPGTREVEFWASPRLKRSCSDLALRREEVLCHDHRIHGEGTFLGDAGSPVSVMTHRSADKIILKKHSSSQILPSRSRKLWWKLLLWSHRNLRRPASIKPNHIAADNPSLNRQGGYCSDTMELRPTEKANKLALPGSCTGDFIKTGNHSSMWTQNQWVALPTESSPFNRVEEWMKGISGQASLHTDCDKLGQPCIIYPPSPADSISPARASLELAQYPAESIPDDIVHANNVIQSLNASSSVAHMTNIGLKVIPSIYSFSSLRSINLSGNYIIHIPPGSLPKGVHELNLSRNKINALEGLRELTQLRVLDLSYNRISRIGQGLSNCTFIKELYLSGNKISHVEGLHRLVKLTVLDLSFNKITTSKALGHLVANYNSLITLNLVGNPIQSNMSEEQVRRMVCSLLPKVAYLNKQAVNSQKAREVSPDTMAAVRGSSNSRSSRRRRVQRQVSMASSAATAQKGKLRATKSFPQHRSSGAAAVKQQAYES